MKSPFDRNEIQRPEGDPDFVRTIDMEKYERCSFCCSKLVFSHDLNFTRLQVIETSQCPGCGVAMNPKKFTLQ